MKESLYHLIRNGKKGWGPACLKALLWVLSLVYRVLIELRSALFSAKILSSVKLAKPVISVGNITTGGVGKTPFVAMLARHFVQRHKKPAILLRGYMGRSGTNSDEAVWYERYVPQAALIVGEDRAAESRKYLSHSHCDIFLMDDGFQHLGLKRDLDIVLIDATDPWGGGYLLPRGLLREPVAALRRADVIVVTKTDQAKGGVTAIQERIARLNKKALVVHGVHEPEYFLDSSGKQALALEAIRQKRTVVLCSIGAPRSLVVTLQQLRADVLQTYAFWDHHVYTATDLKPVVETAAITKADYIVTTEKDLVKLQAFLSLFSGAAKLLILRINMQLTKNKDALFNRIDRLL
jgi:tetraacyldisaccharide 4'-kinase